MVQIWFLLLSSQTLEKVDTSYYKNCGRDMEEHHGEKTGINLHVYQRQRHVYKDMLFC